MQRASIKKLACLVCSTYLLLIFFPTQAIYACCGSADDVLDIYTSLTVSDVQKMQTFITPMESGLRKVDDADGLFGMFSFHVKEISDGIDVLKNSLDDIMNKPPENLTQSTQEELAQHVRTLYIRVQSLKKANKESEWLYRIDGDLISVVNRLVKALATAGHIILKV
jgi:hypothetical protein